MNRMQIQNARIITSDSIIERGSLLIENGSITAVSQTALDASNCLTIDVRNHYAAPGFIDLHTHGGGGHDFMDGTLEAYLGAAEVHARHGTTALLPTTLTSTLSELYHTFEVFKQAKKANLKGAQLLGLHLEGPYFSPAQAGAQDPKYIKNPDPKEYTAILDASDDILRWSAAPELPGALEFGRRLRRRGILPSIAHSDATCDEVRKALAAGFTHITHLYSGMSSIKRIHGYRVAGVLESAYLLDDLTVEIIADGAHLPPDLLQLVYKIKGPDRTALATDSMRAAGMPEGPSILGSLKNGQEVIVEDGVAKLLDRTAFAGSVATADRLVRTMTTQARVPLIDAVRMMTATPARILGLTKKGHLAPGMDADIILFDDDLRIHWTLIQGKPIFTDVL